MNPRRIISIVAGIGLLLTAGPTIGQRVVFGTSVSGNANLGSWADAGGLVGLAAGDAICQARAAAAGFGNSQNFVAWLSDASDDAYCRLHGMTGTVDSNCGQATLPVSAGPWVRPDGFPFGEQIGLLLRPNGVVYAPVRLDEFANPLPEAPFLSGFEASDFFTGSSRTGELQGNACDNWLGTPAESAWIGGQDRTTDSWSSAGTGSCSRQTRLLCFERIPGPPLPDVSVNGKIAFVSSASGNGDLSSWQEAEPGSAGVLAGDSICRGLAETASLDRPETFRAWLSDAAENAVDRLDEAGPWVRPDGILIANSKADLTDGMLNTSINVTESGAYLGNFGVWTGTTDLGVAVPDHCNSWTTGTDLANGRTGSANSAGFSWSGGRPEVGAPGTAPFQCAQTAFRLYCFSNDDTILADGFE